MARKKRGNLVTSFSYFPEQMAILEMLDELAEQEGKSTSELIMQLIAEYVKGHGKGNPSFKLDQWEENPEFKAVPALFEKSEKWYKYYEDSDEDDKVALKVAINAISNIIENIDALEGIKYKKRKLK